MRLITTFLAVAIAILFTTAANAECGCGKEHDDAKPACGCEEKADCGCEKTPKKKCGSDVQLLPGADCCPRAEYTLSCDRAQYTCDKPKCEEPKKCKCPESNCGCNVRCKRKGCNGCVAHKRVKNPVTD